MFSLNNILLLIIFLCIFLIIYIFFIYPILLFIISSFKKNDNLEHTDLLGTENSPEITIVIAAYNEENNIEDAINSIFNDGYPHDKLKVLIGIDGKTDNTDIKIQELQKQYPNRIEYKILAHGGKNSVLNQIIPLVTTKYFMVMDADLRLRKNTIEKLVSPMQNKSTGIVLANINISHGTNQTNAGSLGERTYQKFETYIRTAETKIKSTINAFICLLCRTELFEKIPNALVCDDLFFVLLANYKHKRVVFREDAIIDEISSKSLHGEVRRRERMVAGSLATIKHFWKLLLPSYGWTAFFLWSHKLLRYFIPMYLLIIAIATLFLESSTLKDVLIYSQIIIYSLSIIGVIAEKLKISILPLKLLSFFLMMNYGFVRGIIRFIAGEQNSSWKRE